MTQFHLISMHRKFRNPNPRDGNGNLGGWWSHSKPPNPPTFKCLVRPVSINCSIEGIFPYTGAPLLFTQVETLTPTINSLIIGLAMHFLTTKNELHYTGNLRFIIQFTFLIYSSHRINTPLIPYKSRVFDPRRHLRVTTPPLSRGLIFSPLDLRDGGRSIIGACPM